MIISISRKGQISDTRTPQFRSLIIPHLLITLSDPSAMPPTLQQPVSIPIKEKGAQRFCDSNVKWDLQSVASGNEIQAVGFGFQPGLIHCLLMFARVFFCWFPSVVPLVPSRRRRHHLRTARSRCWIKRSMGSSSWRALENPSVWGL